MCLLTQAIKHQWEWACSWIFSRVWFGSVFTNLTGSVVMVSYLIIKLRDRNWPHAVPHSFLCPHHVQENDRIISNRLIFSGTTPQITGSQSYLQNTASVKVIWQVYATFPQHRFSTTLLYSLFCVSTVSWVMWFFLPAYRNSIMPDPIREPGPVDYYERTLTYPDVTQG